MVPALVSDVMSRKICCVPPDATVASVIEEMQKLNIGAVIIQAQGEVLGIFTERDVLKRVAGAWIDPHKTPVSAVMTEKPMHIAPDAKIQVAAILMHKRNFRHLPVMDDGSLVGILSVRDVLKVLVPEPPHPAHPA